MRTRTLLNSSKRSWVRAALCAAALCLGTASGAETTVRLDLGAGPTESGFEGLEANDLYSPGRGYGWVSPSQQGFDVARPPESEAWKGPSNQAIAEDYLVYKEHNNLTRDGIASTNDLDLRVDLADGRYRIKLTFGRLDRAVCSMQLSLNGEVVAQDVDAKHFVRRGAPDHLYGFPRVVRRTVDVSKGSLSIRVHGDDSGFRQRFAEEFQRPPPVSYLAGVPTRNRKPANADLSAWGEIDPRRGVPGGGVWVYADIGCPFTENALSAVEIVPHQEPPLFWAEGGLQSDDPALAAGVEHFNSARFAQAEESFRNVTDKLTRALGLLWIAGAPEYEQERRLLAQVIELLPKQAANPLAGEYLEQARRLAAAIQRFDHAADYQRTYNELLMIWGEVSSFQPGDPMYAKGKIYAGRALFMIDPHRWAFASHAGKQILEDLERQGVTSRYIDWYLHGKWSQDYDDWQFRDYSARQASAPAWAAEVFEAFNRELDLAEWWITHRQQPNGALGGGWGDDVEILRGFGAFVSASPDASPLLADGVRKLSDGVWFSGSIDTDAGYFAEVDDTEHGGEWTADSLAAMTQIDYGNPVYIERALKTAKLMRDLWMDENPRGQFLMRSNFLGAIGIGDRPTHSDSRINFRPASPALSVLRYNSLPAIAELYTRWADAWLDASLSTDRGKPRGVIPQEIAFEDGQLGGVDSPSWYEAAHPPGTVNYDWGGVGSYHQAIVDLFIAAFSATSDRKYLAPMDLEAELVTRLLPQSVRDSPHFARAGRPHPDLWKDLPLGSAEWVAAKLASWPANWARQKSILFPEAGADETPLRTLEQATQMAKTENQMAAERWPHVTTEMIATDRVYFPGLGNGVRVATGFGLFGNSPVATYRGLGREFAAAVLAANAASLRIALYNFSNEPIDAEIVPWLLSLGPTYRVDLGPDADADGFVDRPTSSTTEKLRHRGQGFPVTLPPRRADVVRISKQSGESSNPLAPDLALTRDDVRFVPEYRRVEVTVHNIGAHTALDFEIALYLGGREIGRHTAPHLAAPTELMPQTIRVGFEYVPKTPQATLTVVLDPDDSVDEITERNNRATLTLSTPLVERKRHAHP